MRKQHYKIPFTGLKLGVHEFSFEVTETFFESDDYLEIEKANCHVNLTLEKQSTMLVLTFEISGLVTVPCDRCSYPTEVEANGEYGLIAKFSEMELQNTEEIIYLPPSEYQIDIQKFIFEFIQLSLPVKKTHLEGSCNQDVMKTLDNYLITENQSEKDSEDNSGVDPRWAALNKLKKKN